jgi:hypothetical protein
VVHVSGGCLRWLRCRDGIGLAVCSIPSRVSHGDGGVRSESCCSVSIWPMGESVRDEERKWWCLIWLTTWWPARRPYWINAQSVDALLFARPVASATNSLNALVAVVFGSCLLTCGPAHTRTATPPAPCPCRAI